MKTSCISHPPNERLLLIRQWQLEVCDGNACAAALLSFFEYWHNVKIEQTKQEEQAVRAGARSGKHRTRGEALIQYHSETQLEQGILHLYARDTIRKALKLLQDKGFVSVQRNPDSRYYYDHVRHILFNTTAVSRAMHEAVAKRASDERRVTTRIKNKRVHAPPHRKIAPPPPKSRSTIPEITITETTNSRRSKPLPYPPPGGGNIGGLSPDLVGKPGNSCTPVKADTAKPDESNSADCNPSADSFNAQRVMEVVEALFRQEHLEVPPRTAVDLKHADRLARFADDEGSPEDVVSAIENEFRLRRERGQLPKHSSARAIRNLLRAVYRILSKGLNTYLEDGTEALEYLEELCADSNRSCPEWTDDDYRLACGFVENAQRIGVPRPEALGILDYAFVGWHRQHSPDTVLHMEDLACDFKFMFRATDVA